MLKEGTYISDLINSSVSSQTEVSTWDIVTDGTGNYRHGDAELWILVPCLFHGIHALESL